MLVFQSVDVCTLGFCVSKTWLGTKFQAYLIPEPRLYDLRGPSLQGPLKSETPDALRTSRGLLDFSMCFLVAVLKSQPQTPQVVRLLADPRHFGGKPTSRSGYHHLEAHKQQGYAGNARGVRALSTKYIRAVLKIVFYQLRDGYIPMLLYEEGKQTAIRVALLLMVETLQNLRCTILPELRGLLVYKVMRIAGAWPFRARRTGKSPYGKGSAFRVHRLSFVRPTNPFL